MKTPLNLYRYRPLNDADSLLDRELGALRESYLYAPSFADLNDPMEAFVKTGHPGDRMIDAILAPTGRRIEDMYEMLRHQIEQFGIVSFAGTHDDLPMWAYYASNFAGMCLEFDTGELAIGDFFGESLQPVIYAHNALPPLTLANVTNEQSLIARLTRKRCEWAHEKEWRFITGEFGRKHYLDDALRRVFLGPRVDEEHAARVCKVLERRPVEVLQGDIRGFELSFRVIQPATLIEKCERVGSGRLERTEYLYSEERLRAFLAVPLDILLEECRQNALRPNTEELAGVNLASDSDAIYLQTIYKLRNGRNVYHKRYFDQHLRLIEGCT